MRRAKVPVQGPRPSLRMDDLKASLTRRQFEVLQLLRVGCNRKEICRALGIASQTVASYQRELYLYTGIHSQIALVAGTYREEVSGLREIIRHLTEQMKKD